MTANQHLGDLTHTELKELADAISDTTHARFLLSRPPDLGGYLLLQTPSGDVAVDPFVTTHEIRAMADQVASQGTVHVTSSGARSVSLEP